MPHHQVIENIDELAGAGGFEPPHGGIKILPAYVACEPYLRIYYKHLAHKRLPNHATSGGTRSNDHRKFGKNSKQNQRVVKKLGNLDGQATRFCGDCATVMIKQR